MSNEQRAPNWQWADQIFLESEYGDTFKVVECQFDRETGEHRYYDEAGNCLVVNQYASIYLD